MNYLNKKKILYILIKKLVSSNTIKIRLGRLINGNVINNFYLEISDLNGHIGVFGMSGYGKTNTVMKIISESSKLGYNYIIFDWHNEYKGFIKNIGGVYIDLSEGKFNPFISSISIDLSEHISFLVDIFSEALELSPSQSHMLESILFDISKTSDITLNKIIDRLKSSYYRISSSRYENEIRAALLRRLEPIAHSSSSKMFNTSKSMPISNLLERGIALGFGNIIEERLKVLIAFALLRIIYAIAMKNLITKKTLLIIEEARNIVPRKRLGESPSIGEKIVSELRKKGISVIIVSQLPTQISKEIVKSLKVIFLHKITSIEDINEVLGLSPWSIEYKELFKKVKSLNIGHALVIQHESDSIKEVIISKVASEIKDEIIALEFDI